MLGLRIGGERITAIKVGGISFESGLTFERITVEVGGISFYTCLTFEIITVVKAGFFLFFVLLCLTFVWYGTYGS